MLKTQDITDLVLLHLYLPVFLLRNPELLKDNVVICTSKHPIIDTETNKEVEIYHALCSSTFDDLETNYEVYDVIKPDPNINAQIIDDYLANKYPTTRTKSKLYRIEGSGLKINTIYQVEGIKFRINSQLKIEEV